MNKYVLGFALLSIVGILWFLSITASISESKKTDKILSELSSTRNIIDNHNKSASETLTKCVYYCVDSYTKNDQLNDIFWEVCYVPSVENILYHQWVCTKTCSGGW
jgi:hypothetical protein